MTQGAGDEEGLVERVRVSRVIAAPRERVFRAFTAPEELVRWWGPPEVRTLEAEVELRPGGACRWLMQAPGEAAMTLRGRVLEVDAPSLLVMTNRWEHEAAETRVTVRFELVPAGTRVVIEHEDLPEKESGAYAPGWELALDSLEAVIHLIEEA